MTRRRLNFDDGVWDELKACEKRGAAISHHHGIGHLEGRRPYGDSGGVLF